MTAEMNNLRLMKNQKFIQIADPYRSFHLNVKFAARLVAPKAASNLSPLRIEAQPFCLRRIRGKNQNLDFFHKQGIWSKRRFVSFIPVTT